MDAEDIIQRISDTFEGLDVLRHNGDAYFYYDPDGILPPNRRMPFATVMTTDAYDQVSNLDRPGLYRLNIGVSKQTYQGLFGPNPPPPGSTGTVDTGHDFSVVDTLLPHPVYAHQSWVCILNPCDETFRTTVTPLLQEAYDLAASRYKKPPATDVD